MDVAFTNLSGKTAHEIEQALEARIRAGLYPEGARLPTVRDLARQMGINKNTAIRVYQSLERKGYLDLIRGRGVFVRHGDAAGKGADIEWNEQVDKLITNAHRRSIRRELLLEEFRRRVDVVYGARELRIAFIECNAQDIDALGAELSTAIGYRPEGMLLSEVALRRHDLLERFDLVVTTFYHLGEVTQVLGRLAEKKVVGVHAKPDHHALLQLARLHVPVIGLVCEQLSTIESLSYIVKTYHPSAMILTAFVSDARLSTLLTKADAIVVTRSCYERLMSLQPLVPVIPVTFTIEQQSIDFLRTRIQEEQG